VFLALNSIGTAVTILLGQQTYGYGYLVASAISGLAALFVLEKTMQDLAYLTFVVSNAKKSLGSFRELASGSARARIWT
jgi:uncharacterized membrane protein